MQLKELKSYGVSMTIMEPKEECDRRKVTER